MVPSEPVILYTAGVARGATFGDFVQGLLEHEDIRAEVFAATAEPRRSTLPRGENEPFEGRFQVQCAAPGWLDVEVIIVRSFADDDPGEALWLYDAGDLVDKPGPEEIRTIVKLTGHDPEEYGFYSGLASDCLFAVDDLFDGDSFGVCGLSLCFF